MKNIAVFERFLESNKSLNESSINDWGKENLVGKSIKFPNGKLKVMFKQWRGDYASMGNYEEKVNPDDVFTVTKLEKVYWGSRGEKSTAPLLFVQDKSGREYMLTAMDYEPVDVVS